MSFILDALKKSEAERRHGEVPKLQNESFPPPRRGRTVWLPLLVSALLLNVAVCGWWLFGKMKESPPPAGSARSEPVRQPAAPLPSVAHPPELPAAVASERNVASAATAFPPAPPPQAADLASAEPTVATVVMPAPPGVVPPSAERGRPTAPADEPVAPAPSRGDVSPPAGAYPPLAELSASARASLPDCDLQLHFYTPEPERRLVRLNGRNLHEGETDGAGLLIDEITPEGVRLECRGVRFFLPAGRRPRTP